MNNIFTLYKAELRKILSKKAVWAAMAIGLGFVLLAGLTNLSADGHRAYVKQQEEILSEISGNTMDDAFFSSFINEVKQYEEAHPELFDHIRASDPGAVFQNAASAVGKDALYQLIYNTVRSRDAVSSVDAESFYAAMRENIILDGRELGSPEKDISVWLASYDSIEKPITYSYALAYLNILDILFLIGWVLIINTAIALSGVFADEKTYRTDAMILSARNGRTPVCMAKVLAGISVAISQAVLLFGVCFGVIFFFYGTTGWNAMIQNVIPSSPWNITIGTMLLLYIALAVLTSVFFAMTNMILSHVTKSAVVTMAIHAAVIFAGLFNVPGKLGTIAGLWALRPTMALYYGTFCNTFMYGRFNNVQISFLLYTGTAAILAILLTVSYVRSQAESR